MTKKIRQLFDLSRGEKALATAYAAVGATSAGMAYFVMTGNNTGDLQAQYPFGTDAGVVCVGALSGLMALYLSRGWMGMLGALGVARAAVGACAMALIASVIAGAMIAPLSGTFFAPIMLVAAFWAKPWLAGAWFMVALMAHALFVRHTKGVRSAVRTDDGTAIGQLSTLSQVNLYRNRNHLQ